MFIIIALDDDNATKNPSILPDRHFQWYFCFRAMLAFERSNCRAEVLVFSVLLPEITQPFHLSLQPYNNRGSSSCRSCGWPLSKQGCWQDRVVLCTPDEMITKLPQDHAAVATVNGFGINS
jgi:hypothetical protein